MLVLKLCVETPCGWHSSAETYCSDKRLYCYVSCARKIKPPPGFDPRTVQPVTRRYTDYAIPAAIFIILV